MCNFVSWIEYEGKNYFLENADLDTKQGKKLLAEGYRDDIEGHGAIQHYYPELTGKGKHKECENFSSPDNFPTEVAQALVQGKLTRIGIAENVLNDKGKKEYEKIIKTAYVECDKTIKTAYAEYEKIELIVYAKYLKIQQPAWDKYLKINQTEWDKYLKIQQNAYAEYRKIGLTAYAKIVKQKKYRKLAWKGI